MNKYQEALDYLKGGNLFGELSDEALDSILELVDKEIAVEGIQTESGCYCDKCGNRVGDNNDWTQILVNYCSSCGQRIDWSGEE